MRTEAEIRRRISDKEAALRDQDKIIAAINPGVGIPKESAAMVFALRRELEALRWVLS